MLFICEKMDYKIMNKNISSNLIKLYTGILEENRTVGAVYRVSFASDRPYIIYLLHQTHRNVTFIYLWE